MNSQRILVVEDDADVASTINASLTARGYVVVGGADSGEEALALAQEHRPDLVLMDIQLGGEWDGVDAAQALRDRLGISVLYLTGDAGRDTVQRAKATIPAGYLLKPFSERELIVAVEMALIRQQLESSLRAERERLNVTLQSIGDGVITTDVDARVVLINSVAEELTGWSQEEAVGRQLSEIFRTINERTREPSENPVARVLETGRSIGHAQQTALIARNGSERAIADSAAPISSAGGQPLGAVLVFRDVTLQLKIEQEIQRTQRLESVGVLAGGIAHDFNNLLTVISANVSFAAGKVAAGDTEMRAILDDVLAACDRAAQLTQQLLTFAGGGAPVRRPTMIAELVRSTVDFALRGSESHAVYDIQTDLWLARIDAGQMSQVITNLIVNADESMKGGGVIEVLCANRRVTDAEGLSCAAGDYVEVTVTDHGSGIAPEIKNRIFEPYFSTKHRGSGLGLASAYSIVRKHDGVLAVESGIGQGATFRLLLPAAAGPGPAGDAPSSRAPHGVQHQGRVLVMDDESSLRTAMSLILTDLGYEVASAADGIQAIECFARAAQIGKPFDVVLLDLTVRAGMGGLEALVGLRQIDADVRAIATSGYAPDPVLAAPEKFGFVSSLPKPYRREQLGLLVQRARRHDGALVEGQRHGGTARA